MPVRDRKGRIIRRWTAEQDAMCLVCEEPEGELMSPAQAYRHHDKTGHPIRIQRIKMTDVRRDA